MTFIYNFVIMYKLSKNRGVAQLVARSVRDAEVVGSIPVASTKNAGNCLNFLHFLFILSSLKIKEFKDFLCLLRIKF